MFTCKQVSVSLESDDYEQLNRFSKAMLKLHVALCIFCGKYNRQRMTMHDTFREFRRREDSEELAPEAGLTDADRDRIKQAIKRTRPGTKRDMKNASPTP